MCSSNGFPYNFDVYTGKDSSGNVSEQDLLGTRVVKKMLKCVEKPELHQVFFDNFFTSYNLLAELREKGFRATGTARENRLQKCPLPESKVFQKSARGNYASQTDGIVTAVKWNDNRAVVVASNYESSAPEANVRRY